MGSGVADGWIGSSRTDLTAIGSSLEVVRGAAAEAGREPDVVSGELDPVAIRDLVDRLLEEFAPGA